MSITIPPSLQKELHPEKTLPFIDELAKFATSKIWWQCSLKHDWEATIYNRKNGTNCPTCSNRRILVGFNDLASKAPHLAKEWHPTKNTKNGFPLLPTEIVYASGHKAEWVCMLNHEWQATIYDRYQNKHNCPYCSGNKILEGFNDLASKAPQLAKEWHPTKNGTLLPTQVGAMSNKKVWWLGQCGHDWDTPVSKRSSGRGCSICANQKVLSGFNDLATTHPQLAQEWVKERNIVSPSEVITGGTTKYWWKCKNNHFWEASINKRKQGHGCHYCTGQKVIEFENDLVTVNPSLAAEWHPTKNENLLPTQVSAGSNKKVWWLGECGHDWDALVRERAGYHKTNCPKCPTVSSKAEKEIAKYIQKLLPDTLIEYGVKNLINRTELDIYIPSKNIAIEYNGLYWHSEQIRSNTQYHYDKWLACKEKNITLIQIWEDVWRDNPQLVKQLLSELLVPSLKAKIEGTFCEISEAEANDFLTKNHVNGFLKGTLYYAIKDTNLNMIAVLVLNKDTSNKNIKIVRYASSQNNVDSFGQLIEQIRNSWGEEWQLTGVSDNMLYEDYIFLANDFIEVEVVKPLRVPIHLNSRILNESSLLEYKNHVWDAGHTIWKNK